MYEARESETDYRVGLVDTGTGPKRSWERSRTATDRTEQNDQASEPAEQVFEFVAADVVGTIGIVTHEAPQGGNAQVFVIESGNTNGDFQVSNLGALSRTPGHTLTGSYVLLISHTEGSPLFRKGSTQVTVTVA